MNRKYADLKEKSIADLNKSICETKVEILTLRMQHARNTLKNPLLIREKRRIVARMKTIIAIKSKESGNA